MLITSFVHVDVSRYTVDLMMLVTTYLVISDRNLTQTSSAQTKNTGFKSTKVNKQIDRQINIKNKQIKSTLSYNQNITRSEVHLDFKFNWTQDLYASGMLQLTIFYAQWLKSLTF